MVWTCPLAYPTPSTTGQRHRRWLLHRHHWQKLLLAVINEGHAAVCQRRGVTRPLADVLQELAAAVTARRVRDPGRQVDLPAPPSESARERRARRRGPQQQQSASPPRPMIALRRSSSAMLVA